MSTQTTATDTAAIQQVVADANTYQNDLERFLSLHTEDVLIVNIAGRRVIGRDNFRDAMARALHSRLRNVITRSEIVDITFVRPDTAVVSCVKHVDDQNADASSAAIAQTGSLTYLMVREGGSWRIALAQTTPVAA